jgi:cytoskeletal protein CcmA (bactofilin family)
VIFGRDKKRRQPAINTLVGADTRVHGDIEFTGGFHVDGYVQGNVKAVRDEAATLSISERGCVEGAVLAPHVLLNGTVKGDVRATERVELGPRARVIGNVQYRLIEMAVGAEVNGKLIHDSEDIAASAQQTRVTPLPEAAAVGETQ